METGSFFGCSIKKVPAALAAFFLFLLLGTAGCSGAVKEPEEQPVEVLMIHNNPCESCDEPGKLTALFGELAPQSENGYRESVYYAYAGEGQELVKEAAAHFGLEKKNIVFPLVIVGEKYLMGYAQLEAELTECLEEAAAAGVTAAMAGEDSAAAGTDTADPEEVSLTEDLDEVSLAADPDGISLAAGSDEVSLAAEAGADAIHLLYFHTEICGSCEKAERFLETLPETVELEGRSLPLSITALSVAEAENALLFEALAENYQVPERERQVPLLFAGDTYLSGEKAIREGTKQLLAEGKGRGFVYEADLAGARRTQQAEREKPAAFLLKTAGVGFLNGFNPCALSLTLLFLSLIAALPGGFLRYGFSFLAGKLLAYTLLGFAAAMALSAIPFEAFAGVRLGMNVVLMLLCILLAAGNLWDCFHAARGEFGKIRVQLPGRLRRFNDRLVKRIVDQKAGPVLMGMIFLGSMAVSGGEFFCTGQIYLASILQWVQQGGQAVSIAAFVLYSAALCLPSLLLLFLVYRGKSVFSLTGASLKGMPLIKLCNAALFILFAITAAAQIV